MHQKQFATIYTPESELRYPIRLLSKMLTDIFNSRELAWRLFVRNISSKYRQTLGGYFWAILPPILTSALWIFLNTQKIFIIEKTAVPYPLYVLVGTILWQVFVNSINAPIIAMKQSAPMITKINFPREAIIVAAFLEILFTLIIQLCLLISIFIYFKITIFPFQMIWSLCGIFGIIMMGMMIGILLTPMSILYDDIQRGLPIILQLLFYLTPIVYSVPESGWGSFIAVYNPLSPLIQLTRELIITNKVIFLKSSLIICSSTLLLLFLGWLLYRIALPHLIERISA